MAYEKNSTYKPGLRMPPYVHFQNPDVAAKDLNTQTPSEQHQTMINAEGGVIPLVYGRGRVGGKIFVITQYQGQLIVGCVLCEGEIDAIESVDINDIASTDTAYTAVSVTTLLGTTTQTAPTVLTTALAGYTDTLRYTINGTTETASSAYAVIKVPSGVVSGFPRIAAVVRGKKVYDPRDSSQTFGNKTTYKYSNNPALCIADLITSTVYGLGKSVNWASVANTANFNDQMVGNPAEKSRQLDMVIDKEQEVSAWIEILRAYASCFVIEENGVYELIPDKPIGYAANFTGASTSYGTITYTAAQTLTSEVSFEVSIKANAALASTTNQCIFSRGVLNSEQIGLYHSKSTGTTTVVWTDTNARRTVTFPNVIPTTAYQTISFSYKKNTAAFVAVNGISVALSGSTATYNYDLVSNTTAISLGYVAGGSFNPYYGCVDEFRMWNRYRDLSEITSNFNRALVTKYDPSLIIHIPFNEGHDSFTNTGTWSASSIAKDKTGNIVGATLYPQPTYGTASGNWSQYDNPADFFKFDQTNVLADSTKFRRRGVANIPTIVEIAFTDTTSKPWREDYAREDQSIANNYKRRVSNVQMPGITRYSQAYREAVERYNNIVSDSTVMFTAWDDSLALQVSDGIQFHHPTIESFDAGTQTYNSIFKPYRITSIREKEFSKFDIVAVEYDPLNYSTIVATAPTYPDTNLPKIDNPPAASGATAAEKLYKSNEGVWGSRIQATITPSTSTSYPYTQGFLVKLYKNVGPRPLIEQVFVRANPTAPSSGTVEYLSSVLNPFETADNITYPVNYQLEIYTVSTINILSPKIDKDVSVLGKYTKPSDIVNFSGWELMNKVLLKWDESIDIDVWKYDLRYAPAVAATDTASLQAAYATAVRIDLIDALAYTAEGIPAGTWRFFVSAVDSIGQYSNVPAYVDVVVTLDTDAFGLVTKTYTDWTGLGMSKWNIRGDNKPYWSTDWADPWNLNEAGVKNTTATFGITAGALENTHGYSLTFNATTPVPYISIAHAAGHTSVGVATVFTIEAYIYVNGNVGGNQVIFTTRSSSAAGAWTFAVGNGSGGVTDTGRLYIAEADNTTLVRESVNNVIFENTWHHVCAVITGTAVGNARLYVDLMEVSYNGSGNAYTYIHNTNNKIIGALNSSGTAPLTGNIKRVKWYAKALSDSERIQSAEYVDNQYSITSLIGSWTINEGTGSTITDSASISNGTVSNTPTWTNTSYLSTESWDYGASITGNWLMDLKYTDHGGSASTYILTSLNDTTWAYNPGISARAPARYIRALIATTGNVTITDWPKMSLVLEPKSESTPVIRTLAAGSGGKLVQLDNEYSSVKSILITPIGFATSGTAASISGVVDRILVAPVTGLKFTGELTTAGTLTASAIISTASRTISSSEYLEFDTWAPSDTADLNMTVYVKVNYSAGGSATSAVTLSGGQWVSNQISLSASQTISSVGIYMISAVSGVHSIVIRRLRTTSNTANYEDVPNDTLFTIWDDSGEPSPNTLGGGMLNKMCGPANSFLLYGFQTTLNPGNVTTQVATDLTVKFEGS